MAILLNLVKRSDVIHGSVPTESVLPSSDHYCIDTVAPSGDHCFTNTVAPSSDHYCSDLVVPHSDHYGTRKVAPPSDHLHYKERNNVAPSGYATEKSA